MSNLLGTGQNQAPTNGNLGTLAYQNAKDVVLTNINVNQPATGTPATITAIGGDTNIDVNVATKGTGVFRVNNVALNTIIAAAIPTTLPAMATLATLNYFA